MKKIAWVTGSGGFIGHHLLHSLADRGYQVLGIDLKNSSFCAACTQVPCPLGFYPADLQVADMVEVLFAVHDLPDEIYHLAADMGGIGYITENRARIATSNVLIDALMLREAARARVPKFFYASSACVYPTHQQVFTDARPLHEVCAWPARPEEGYGLEKLYMEKLCEYYTTERLVETRVARFHNCFGPNGTWAGGAEKAPAALCRKVAEAQANGEIEIWGDGEQTRSFMYIDDCVEGIYRIMQSDYTHPLNLGTDRMVTINELARIIIGISGKKLSIRHVEGPQGVRGRNSDNSELRRVLNWEPQVSLEAGLEKTYKWIADQVAARGKT